MWILDSRTYDYVFHFTRYFSDIKIIEPINIYLPNMNNLISNLSGTIILDPYLHLHNALASYLFQNHVRISNIIFHPHTILITFKKCLQRG